MSRVSNIFSLLGVHPAVDLLCPWGVLSPVQITGPQCAGYRGTVQMTLKAARESEGKDLSLGAERSGQSFWKTPDVPGSLVGASEAALAPTADHQEAVEPNTAVMEGFAMQGTQDGLRLFRSLIPIHKCI